ncbi:hypothetical protein P8C59_007058 [Phyllachora maydis]|uniref:Uncharacterized protein n=1 Tax=Phyllachora maydis TaxID=1825666 RepID=A0AAD9MHM1_9PEZI|nr:hypothetical protein P8C59_007058 [Phyllachora maydis]
MIWSTVARNLQLQRGGRTGPTVTCPSPDRTNPSDPNPADLNPNPAASSPLGAINKAPKRSGHSFPTHLTTATTATATTTTTTSAANPATTITATRSSDISFDSLFKGLSSTSKRPTRPVKTESSRPIGP